MLWVLIWWVPTTYVFMDNWRKLSLIPFTSSFAQIHRVKVGGRMMVRACCKGGGGGERGCGRHITIFFFCTAFCFFPLPLLSISFLSCTTSSVLFLPFCVRSFRITRSWVQILRQNSSHDCIVVHCTELSLSPFCHQNLNNVETDVYQASVAQLDARPTGDQEVVGSTHAGLATFFHGDWSWNIFYGHSLPLADSRRAGVSFWQKNVHNTG